MSHAPVLLQSAPFIISRGSNWATGYYKGSGYNKNRVCRISTTVETVPQPTTILLTLINGLLFVHLRSSLLDLYSTSIRPLFVLLSYSLRPPFVLPSYSLRTLFVLSSYAVRYSYCMWLASPITCAIDTQSIIVCVSISNEWLVMPVMYVRRL